MELLESKVGSGLFLEALTGVNMEIARKRVERKRQRAVEKATDPVAAAERRKDRMEAGKVRIWLGCGGRRHFQAWVANWKVTAVVLGVQIDVVPD